jgi:predicted RNase H-like HicB family nuclease
MADANDRLFTAIIEREDDAYVALCPELDIASQGGSIEDTFSNLREAVDLFFQAADPREVRERRRVARAAFEGDPWLYEKGRG